MSCSDGVFGFRFWVDRGKVEIMTLGQQAQWSKPKSKMTVAAILGVSKMKINAESYFCCSVTKLCLTLCDSMTAALQAPLSSTISQSFLKFMSIDSVMLSNHLILRCLLLLFLIFPIIRVFSKESALPIRWPQYWSFGFSINQYAIKSFESVKDFRSSFG